jgi:hypothetical protein
MTVEEAKAIAEEERQLLERSAQASDPDREAPPAGGAAPAGAPDQQRNEFGAGNVGGYNAFWIDRGSEPSDVDGKVRTSIIFDPPNGRQPPMTAKGMKQMMSGFASFAYQNDGTANWLDKEGPGPFDGPESLALAERCLLGFSAGPPMLPGLYNNFKKIVQTEHHVSILMEMVHDARVVRLDSEHDPAGVRKWLGDSIGWWEGDTLVVETTNFTDKTNFRGSGQNLRVQERFTRVDEDTLLYQFTVEDPESFVRRWSGEIPMKKVDGPLFEYACHEGNLSMVNILSAARAEERAESEAVK